MTDSNKLANKLDEARAALVVAAAKHAVEGSDVALKALCEAATVYGQTRLANAKPPPPTPSGELTMPFGRSKGKAISAAEFDDLEWMLPKIEASIADESKARWRSDNEALAIAIRVELAERSVA